MKKILFLILSLFFFLFIAKPSFAQTTRQLDLGYLFDLNNPIKNMVFDNSNDTVITLKPVTSITIQKNSFSQKNVIVISYIGKWDGLKNSLLPKDQSPITAYYFVFRTTNGQILTPEKPILVTTINNFIKTKTFYYPLTRALEVDKQNQKTLVKEAPAVAKLELPLNDFGFVIGVDKTLDRNDPGLSFGKEIHLTSSPVPSFLLGNLDNITLYKIGVIVLVIIIVAILGFLYYSKNKPRKIRKVEEPKKIIVGGK